VEYWQQNDIEMLQNWKSSPALALFALLLVTAIWGSTFIVVQDAIAQMPVMDFLAVRFGIAALFMLAMRPACLRGMSRTGFVRGGVLGLVLGLGYITQTFGLQHTSATVSGFITGMSVVLTPVVLWGLLRRKIGRQIWVAVFLAVIGLAFLGLRGWAMGWGELLTLGCALCFALHIVGLGEWSARHDIYGLVFLQIATVAVISLLAATPQGISLPPNGAVWLAVGVTAVLATAVAFFIQTWAQSLVAPTRVALVLTMEPVFAGLFGVLLGGDQITTRIIIGAALVLSAMLIAELKSNQASVNLSR
jgi:drug/metabolite transporter (DMT)-like permease